jgi:hypothetical protein
VLEPPDPLVEARMRPLIERGRARLRQYLSTFDPYERPIGGESLNVVDEGDFCAHVVLCMRHVTVNERPLYILCANGDLCALLSPLTWRRK